MAHILIVEDEVTFRSVIRAALIQNGHTVVEAGDGRTGLELLKSQVVDLVITDVMMPDQDGIEVIMRLREKRNPAPIIAITGHPVEAELYLKVAKSLGAQRVLEKPFSMETLLTAIRDVLAS